MSDPGFEFHMKKTDYSPEHRAPETFDFRKHGMEAMDHNYMALGNVIGSMHLTEQKSGVNVNAYGESFKDRLRTKERAAAMKKSGTELYEKAQNKKLIEGAEKEYSRRLDEFTKKLKKGRDLTVPQELQYDFENCCVLFRMKDPKAGIKIWNDYCADGEQRYGALDHIVEDFVNQDFDFDLSNDSVIASQALKFLQMKYRSDAFLSLISRNLEYWSAVDDVTKGAVMKKLSQAELLWDFYVKKEALITDAFYSSRMNSELSYTDFSADDLKAMERNQEVMNKIHEADDAYERLRMMEEPDREERVREARVKKINAQVLLSNTAVPVGRQVQGKSKGFEFMDIFGLPLKVTSFFMRDKRTADHGRVRYEKEAEAFDKKFPQYLQGIGEGKRHGFYRGPKGNDYAPPIILEDFFTDPVKLSITTILKENNGLLKGKSTPDEKSTQRLFEDFTDAAERYTKIRGIVNADTTEMEMAFLDRMKEIEEKFEKGYAEDRDVSELSKKRAAAVKSVMEQIRSCLYGNLRNVTAKTIFESAVTNSTAVIQSTTITDNMDESNIRDIPLFTHYPNINDIKQSTIGDCYLVGAMTSFVRTSPQGVLDMFQDLGDGNVLVRLYEGYDQKGNRLDNFKKWSEATRSGNGEMRPMFVKLRKHYETGDGNANDCVWPQLIEKAYAAAGFNMKGDAVVDEKGQLHDMEKELTAGYGFIAMSHMTGTLQKRYSVAPLKDKQNRLSKRLGKELFQSDDFQNLLGAGIPQFLMNTLVSIVPDKDAINMDAEYFEYWLGMALRLVSIEYGSKLLQIKKNFIRKGFDSTVYAPIITGIADRIGLTLADDWDEQGSSEIRLMGKVSGSAQFNLEEDNQEWETLFDMNHDRERYINKYRQNYNALKNGQPLTFDAEKGFDTQAFSDENINTLLDTLMQMTGRNSPDDLALIQPQIGKTIDASLSFGGDEDLKQKAIDEHREKAEKFLSDKKNKDAVELQMKKMQFVNNSLIRDNALDFMIVLRDTLEAGGTVEISINHFISAVGMAMHNNQWFVLIKDPFNVYNMSYERDKKYNVVKHEQGFMDVLNLDGHHYKRHLDEEGDLGKNLAGGFGGLSWWTVDDLAKKMKDYTPVLPGQVKHRV